MALSSVDKLNNLTTSTKKTSSKPRAIDYETYFGEMELADEEIEERIALAEDLDDVFEYLFVLYLALLAAGKKVDRDELVRVVLDRYRDVIESNGMDMDERYPGLYGISERSSDNIVETTLLYGAIDPWYTSEDRAMFLAENEANTIANYADLMDAIDAGYTLKTWRTMADRKVRDTHRELEGETISIFEPFDVGGYQMMVPKDDSMGAGPEEIVNCRCSVQWGGLDGDADEEYARKTGDRRENIRAISDKRFNDLTTESRMAGAIIERGTELALWHLDRMGADAATMNDVMYFREKVTASEAAEENYHVMQYYRGLNSDKPFDLRYILNEIDAQEYLLKNAKKLRIPRRETEQTENALEIYKSMLEDYYERHQ